MEIIVVSSKVVSCIEYIKYSGIVDISDCVSNQKGSKY